MVKASDVILILVGYPFYSLSHKNTTTGFYNIPSYQVAILFPPAAAAMVTGCSCDLIINILLTMYVSHSRLTTFEYLLI